MIDHTKISFEDLSKATSSISERVELSGQLSKLFVDINLLERLVQPNQAIYGRRGTGKTHLQGRNISLQNK